MPKYRCRQCKAEIRQESKEPAPECCEEKMLELKIQKPRHCCSNN